MSTPAPRGPPKEPPDRPDQGASSSSTASSGTSGGPQGSQGKGYAAAVAASNNQRKETKWIQVEMFKSEKSTKLQMTEEEHAKIVRKLNINPKQLYAIDDHQKITLHFEIDANVDLSTLNLHEAIQVRKGLRTKPVKQHAHMEFIKVYKTSIKDSDASIAEMFADFGEVLSITKQTYQPKRESSETLKQMAGVKKGDRDVTLRLHSYLPSFGVLTTEHGTKKVKFTRAGAIKTCVRCGRKEKLAEGDDSSLQTCPAEGDPTACKTADPDFNKTQEQIWDEWRLYARSQRLDAVETVFSEITADTVEVFNINILATREDLKAWLDSKNVVIPLQKIQNDENPRKKKISGLSKEEVMSLLDIHGSHMEYADGTKSRLYMTAIREDEETPPVNPQQQQHSQQVNFSQQGQGDPHQQQHERPPPTPPSHQEQPPPPLHQDHQQTPKHTSSKPSPQKSVTKSPSNQDSSMDDDENLYGPPDNRPPPPPGSGGVSAPSTISSLPTPDYSSLYNQLQSVLFSQQGANSLTPREFEEADQIQQAQLLHRAIYQSNLFPIETSTAKHPLSLPGVTPNNISTIEQREEEDVLNKTDDTEEPNPPEAFVTASDVEMESVPSLKHIAQTTVNKLVDQGADRSVVDDVERLTPERANTSSSSSTAPYEPTTSPNLASQLHLTSTSPKQANTSSPVKPIIKSPQVESPITPPPPVLSISSSSSADSGVSRSRGSSSDAPPDTDSSSPGFLSGGSRPSWWQDDDASSPIESSSSRDLTGNLRDRHPPGTILPQRGLSPSDPGRTHILLPAVETNKTAGDLNNVIYSNGNGSEFIDINDLDKTIKSDTNGSHDDDDTLCDDESIDSSDTLNETAIENLANIAATEKLAAVAVANDKLETFQNSKRNSSFQEWPDYLKVTDLQRRAYELDLKLKNPSRAHEVDEERKKNEEIQRTCNPEGKHYGAIWCGELPPKEAADDQPTPSSSTQDVTNDTNGNLELRSRRNSIGSARELAEDYGVPVLQDSNRSKDDSDGYTPVSTKRKKRQANFSSSPEEDKDQSQKGEKSKSAKKKSKVVKDSDPQITVKNFYNVLQELTGPEGEADVSMQEDPEIIIEEEQNPLQISSQVSQSHLHPEDEDSNEVLIIEDDAKEQREDSASHGSSSK